MKRIITAAAFLVASSAAFAQDVSPGLWEITMETRVPAESGFQPPPYKIRQCITGDTAKDPGTLFSQFGSAGASGCRYTDRNYHGGNSFTFAMTCKGAYAIRSSGRVNFTKETMEGNISAIATIDSRDVETQNKISARRVGGGC